MDGAILSSHVARGSREPYSVTISPAFTVLRLPNNPFRETTYCKTYRLYRILGRTAL